MIGTIVNTLALLVGTSIGCFLKKGINKRFEDVLFIAMGLAALGIGWENVTNNMPKSHYPVLFIVSLALGVTKYPRVKGWPLKFCFVVLEHYQLWGQ